MGIRRFTCFWLLALLSATASASAADGWTTDSVPQVGGDLVSLNAITAESAGDAWAVGSAAVPLILHWDGHAWTQNMPVPSTGELFGVAASSPTDAFAVGERGFSGSIVRWNGASWQSSPSDSSARYMFGVANIPGTATYWAVGEGCISTGGACPIIQHWDGAVWSTVTSPDLQSDRGRLSGVAATSATDAWAVGLKRLATGQERPVLLHWNGIRWKKTAGADLGDVKSARLNTIAPVPGTDDYIAGGTVRLNGSGTTQTLIEYWDGASWSVMSSPSPGKRSNEVTGVVARSADDLWASSVYQKHGTDFPMILHSTGGAWTQDTLPNSVADRRGSMRAITRVPGDDQLLAGGRAIRDEGIRALILRHG